MKEHVIPWWMAWHGRLMVLAWFVLLPLGVLIARYFKVTSKQPWPDALDNKLWWRSHLTLQYSGIAVMSGGLLLAYYHVSGMPGVGRVHRILGWTAFLLGWLQVSTGLFRGSKGAPGVPGDHYDMTARRVMFEYTHKGGGYAAILIAVGAAGTGLYLADAPVWMQVGAVVCWIFWGTAVVWLQRRGYCRDTYQAIWGPSPEHPGNRRKPIGWGVRRV